MLKINTGGLTLQVVLACSFASAAVTALAFVLLTPERWIVSHGQYHIGGTGRILADEAVGSVPSEFDKSKLRLSSTSELKPIGSDLVEGDHISIGGDGGLKRVLQIVDVQRVEVRPKRGTSHGSTPDVLEITVVTARDLDAPEAPPISLIVEDNRPIPTPAISADVPPRASL